VVVEVISTAMKELSVIAMQAVPATEASPPTMVLEAIDPRVLKEPTMAADEDVEATATLTDIAGELEVIPRSKLAMAGARTKAELNSLMSRLVRLWPMPNRRRP
jgi:hypothetical protein